MNTTPSRGSGVANSPDEEVILVVVGALALSALVGSVGLVWVVGVGWLVEHHVLVPADAHPLLAVPGAAGAGLDLPRVAILLALLLAVGAITVSSARRALARSRQEA